MYPRHRPPKQVTAPTAVGMRPLLRVSVWCGLCCLLAASFAAGNATAQGTSVGDLGRLPEYLEEAARNNPELKANFHRWQAALSKVPQAESLPDPRLSFGGYIRPIETRTGPQRAKLGVSQTFPWFGKLSAKGEQAASRAEAARAALDVKKLDVFFSVKSAYYEYAYTVQAAATTAEVLELVRYLERVAQTRYSAGAAPYADVLRTQVELDKLGDRLASIRDLLAPLRAGLNAAMNRPVDTQLPEPPAVPVMRMCLTDAELLRALQEKNPRLLALEHAAAGEQAGITVAKKNFYPDVTAGVETIFTDNARSPGVPNDGENPIIASLSFNLPLWQKPRKAALQEAKSRLAAAQRDKEGLAKRLSAQLELALYKYRDADRRIRLYQETLIPKAHQSLGVSLEAFQAGAATSLDLLDTEKTLLELKLAHLRALTDQALRLAEMETIVGREIPCQLHGSLTPGQVLNKVTTPKNNEVQP